jgi:hypothetical protein
MQNIDQEMSNRRSEEHPSKFIISSSAFDIFWHGSAGTPADDTSLSQPYGRAC